MTPAFLGPRSLPRLALVFGASLLVMGCAGSAPPRSHGGAVPTDHPRIALLPFENLSGREEQGRLFTHAFLAALVETDAAEIVDLGQVETTMEALRIRATGAPSHQQLKASIDFRPKWGGRLRKAHVVSCGTFFSRTMIWKAGFFGSFDREVTLPDFRSIAKSGT